MQVARSSWILPRKSAYAPFFPQVETFEPRVPASLVAAGPAFALGACC